MATRTAPSTSDLVARGLKRRGVNVQSYKFTSNAAKMDAIENLALMLERGEISYPKLDVLVNELTVYGFTKTKTGTTVYNAPGGCHDDCVVALALAAWKQRTPRGNAAWLLV